MDAPVMAAFGWTARPGPVRMLAAALGLEAPVPGSLAFDALAHGIQRYRTWACPGDPPHSMKKKVEVGISTGLRYWQRYRPWEDPSRSLHHGPAPGSWLDPKALPLLEGASARDALFAREAEAAEAAEANRAAAIGAFAAARAAGRAAAAAAAAKTRDAGA
jgi:nucleoid-associated protein YgaU